MTVVLVVVFAVLVVAYVVIATSVGIQMLGVRHGAVAKVELAVRSRGGSRQDRILGRSGRPPVQQTKGESEGSDRAELDHDRSRPDPDVGGTEMESGAP